MMSPENLMKEENILLTGEDSALPGRKDLSFTACQSLTISRCAIVLR